MNEFKFDEAILDSTLRNIESEKNRFKDIDTKAIGIITLTGVLMTFLTKPITEPITFGYISFVFFISTNFLFLITILLCISVIRVRNTFQISTKGLVEGNILNWDEIIGKDELKNFLIYKYNVDWVSKAKISKRGNTINVSLKKKSLSLKLDNNEIEVFLEDGKKDKLTTQSINGKPYLQIDKGLKNLKPNLQKDDFLYVHMKVEEGLQKRCIEKAKELEHAVITFGASIILLIFYSISTFCNL